MQRKGNAASRATAARAVLEAAARRAVGNTGPAARRRYSAGLPESSVPAPALHRRCCRCRRRRRRCRHCCMVARASLLGRPVTPRCAHCAPCAPCAPCAVLA
eukprot:355110-Chlamydomonas_euryale.AAC.3